MTSHNKWLIAKRDVGAERVTKAAQNAKDVLKNSPISELRNEEHINPRLRIQLI